ncbi:hypothetical protein GCM10008967_13080 [Bacillus carboniphilus]|uniref:Ornithine monooxygenase n=1 Tax=Bacillus carboniphilus TaxID=86663 RepID=A0ABP3FT00_9BACI
MFKEMTIQFRVSNIKEGLNWYQTLLKRKPDFIPHEGFAEWELVKGSWLQVAEGDPSSGCGPLRVGVNNIEMERSRLINELGIEPFEIYSREGVPVKWATFSDPWGNQLGFFEYLEKD